MSALLPALVLLLTCPCPCAEGPVGQQTHDDHRHLNNVKKSWIILHHSLISIVLLYHTVLMAFLRLILTITLMLLAEQALAKLSLCIAPQAQGQQLPVILTNIIKSMAMAQA